MTEFLRRLSGHWRAVGILALLIVFTWFAVVDPVVVAFDDQHEQRDRSLRLISAYKNIVESRPTLEAELATLEQQRRSASGLIEGDSAALAAARLQNEIRTIVERHGGEIRSTQNLPVSTDSSFEKIDIGCDLSIPMTGLKSVIYQIETHTPYLFIDKVDIRMPENWQPADENAIAPKLEVRWVVSGYRWVGP